MPYDLVYGSLSDEQNEKGKKGISFIGYLIKNTNLIKGYIEAHKSSLPSEKVIREKLSILEKEINDSIKTGVFIGKKILEITKVDESVIKEREEYLLGLEKVAVASIVNDKKENVVVERDNSYYCVWYQESSIVAPQKFLNSQEFKDIKYGALRMGDGDNIIRLYNGQYHDMKGKLKMTIRFGEEVLEMTLYSRKAHEPKNNALNFGTIMVSMNDENCKTFSKYYEKLKEVKHLERIIDRARSFVQEKTTGEQREPFSVLEEVSVVQCCSHCINSRS
ncbi:hypothetical protein [Wolbachia endosymbiont of Pentidionis agamae]|uniref:hypothetical protein n=1 Tax=Wolbachia endosymbiont of Pentidionis agamae TaxID=3110435 RepID=UPI002FD2AFB4